MLLVMSSTTEVEQSIYGTLQGPPRPVILRELIIHTFHVQQLDNIINISKLLGAWNVRRLTKQGAEVQGFPNGTRLQM